MDNLGIYFKAIITSVLAAISLKLNGLGDLLWLFLAASVLDYIMGVSAAAYNKNLNSGIGFRGIIKKVGAFAAIAVSLIADQVVEQAVKSFGATFSTGGAIATTVTIWLILNELISVLENLAKMNVALPLFLMSAIKLLKQKTEFKNEGVQNGASDKEK